MNRLKQHVGNIVCYDLIFKYHFINEMQIPGLRHITLNTGIGNKAVLDRKHMIAALLSLELISGQKPIITRAKQSIDKFKLRASMPIGCKVTLRGRSAYYVADLLLLNRLRLVGGRSSATLSKQSSRSSSAKTPNGSFQHEPSAAPLTTQKRKTDQLSHVIAFGVAPHETEFFRGTLGAPNRGANSGYEPKFDAPCGLDIMLVFRAPKVRAVSLSEPSFSRGTSANWLELGVSSFHG